jgi:hypothetical protein
MFMAAAQITSLNIHRSLAFGISLFASLGLMLALNLAGSRLITPAAPMGIVSFELAGSVKRAAEILNSWDVSAQRAAAFNMGLDYLFLLMYSLALSLACWMSGDGLRARGWPLAFLAQPLAVGAWLAAAFDAVENIALTTMLLSGAAATPWPLLARLCALLKFALLFLGLVYAFYGLTVKLAVRRISC